MSPGSSKKVPQRLTLIRPIEFWYPWGSKMIPRGPRVTPGVPKVTPRGAQRDPRGAKCEPRGAQSDHRGPPQASKRMALGCPKRFHDLFPNSSSHFFPTLSLRLGFLPNPWPHQPTNTSTLQPNNPSTPLPFNTGPAECAERLNKQKKERNK